ncbi:MAG: biotin--[acetyl-CoA-carboxylase] ligase [SAR202 cluster bacterium]|jgi:BirA family biotin operon repressor/biotin-[acetyl-CoA-carboxylase] ligase|nr:biotin--[acetyl-CoA-carboxylase] ligase [SAR202 cluster bacterium]MDP6511992.1 biotin--[acetyl-CoA-carboxylase] ligase [SAR202 cluster bacterium]MDP6713687.1 biotin--[acetyl-CoA-carboxylase] ligase [SAR202 cluster bacterium]
MAELDIQTLEQKLAQRVVGHRLYYHQSLPSTMDETRRLAGKGAPEGIVVIAEDQTKGRGRFDRPWITPVGLNLAFSVLFRPEISQLPFINMAAALAVCDAVRDLTGLAPEIKWPNDVRINGKKLSGILVETELEGGKAVHAVVGIGLNVNFDPRGYAEIEDVATSLLAETGRRFDRVDALSSVLQKLDEYYTDIKATKSLTERWADRMETLGRLIQVRWKDDVIEGVADSVDDQGNLILKRPDGSSITVVAGEVTLQV